MSEEKNDEIRVKKIESGTVIDHIPASKALKVLTLLGVEDNFPGTVSVIMRVPSTRFGAKDLIKIEGKGLAKKELQKLALIAPCATVNVVKDFKVVEKFRITTPDEFKDVIKCPNPRCITNHECPPLLSVVEKDPLKLRCHYCERVFDSSELEL